MTQKPDNSAQILAGVMTDATKPHPELHDEFQEHAQEVAQTLITDIRANNARGLELRNALGVELSEPTRMGKNLRAAMDAYTTPQR